MIKANAALVEKLMKTAKSISQIDSLPFAPDEVDGIHTFKADEGHGVWFHLKDGRVFNSTGKPSETDMEKYGEIKAKLVSSR